MEFANRRGGIKAANDKVYWILVEIIDESSCKIHICVSQHSNCGTVVLGIYGPTLQLVHLLKDVQVLRVNIVHTTLLVTKERGWLTSVLF